MAKLCLLCCFTCKPRRGRLSADGENNRVEHLEKFQQLEEFCEDLKLNLNGLVGTLKKDWNDVWICKGCLESIEKAVEGSRALRELEMIVSGLQQELLEKMRDLHGAVESWQRELMKMEGIIRNSEEKALLCRRKSEVNEEMADAVVQFRIRIGKMTAEVRKFSGGLFQKFPVAGEKEVLRTNSSNKEGSLEPSDSVEELEPAATTDVPNDRELPGNTGQQAAASSNNCGENSVPSCLINKLSRSKKAKTVQFLPFPTTHSVGPARVSASSGVWLENNDQDSLSDSDTDSTSSEDDWFSRVERSKTTNSGTSAVSLSNTAAHEKLDTLEEATVGQARLAPIPGSTSTVTPAVLTSTTNASQNLSKRVAKPDKPLPESDSAKIGTSKKDTLRRSVRIKSAPVKSAAGLQSKNVKQFSRQCNICERCSSRSSNLETHMNVHSKNRPYRCSRCRKFRLSSENHIRATHTGFQPFTCDICKKRFCRKDHLIRHRRTHTGEKPFPCPLCEFRCSQKCYLKIHMRKHTGEKPFRCNICTQTFRDGSTFKKHQRRKHQG